MPPPAAGTPPGRVTLPAVRLVAPLKQGSCDNLCGLYAIVNALTLSLTPRSVITTADAQALFDAGIANLDGRGALAVCLRDGVPVSLWRDVARPLCLAAEARFGVSIGIERPFASGRESRAATFAMIESLIRRGQPVLVSIEGAYSHYSVIAGVSATSFRLFDSNGLARITRDACGIGTDQRTRRYWLDTRCADDDRGGMTGADPTPAGRGAGRQPIRNPR